MMGRESPPQASLFYTGINLEKRIRSDHVLRKVARLVDFDFVYIEVKEAIISSLEGSNCSEFQNR